METQHRSATDAGHPVADCEDCLAVWKLPDQLDKSLHLLPVADREDCLAVWKQAGEIWLLLSKTHKVGDREDCLAVWKHSTGNLRMIFPLPPVADCEDRLAVWKQVLYQRQDGVTWSLLQTVKTA